MSGHGVAARGAVGRLAHVLAKRFNKAVMTCFVCWQRCLAAGRRDYAGHAQTAKGAKASRNMKRSTAPSAVSHLSGSATCVIDQVNCTSSSNRFPKLIQTAKEVFFIQVGGWDHHSNMNGSAMAKFHKHGRGAQTILRRDAKVGVWSNVIVTTHPKFGWSLDKTAILAVTMCGPVST